MKQKDIATFIVVGVVSLILSVVLSNMIISPSSKRNEQAEVVKPFTAEFKRPDSRYFNNESVNPVPLIQIGNENNDQPFGDQ